MENQCITVAEYAERLLGCPGPKLDLDNLIEKLRPSTSGWESGVLEFKATYLPNPSHPDPDDKYPDKFKWNVFKAMLAMANANGGCVVVGIAEKKDRTGIEPGCYDPSGIITTKQKEDKDLVKNFESEMFNTGRGKERTFTFWEKEGNDGKDEAMSTYHVASEDVDRLKKLVGIYVCRSEQCACNAIVVIVKPLSKGETLIPVMKRRRNRDRSVCFCRDLKNAENIAFDNVSELADYKQQRDPYANNYHQLLRSNHRGVSSRAECPYSTVRFPDDWFRGRDAELERIREVCGKGLIPFVWATGGTGKTQLLLQYARKYASAYAGGSFYLEVNGLKSWDRVFRRLVDEPNPYGSTGRAWLGLPEYVPAKDKDGKDDHKNMVLAPLKMQEIIASISRKSRDVGPVLLVLDNIDEPNDLFSQDVIRRKVFPRDLPPGVDVIASARITGNASSLSQLIRPIKLCDMPEDIAVNVLCGGVIEDGDLPHAKEIACSLGYRAFYLHLASKNLSRYRYEGHPHPMEQVKNDVQRDLLGTLDDPQRVDVIWRKWALPLIRKLKDGEKVIALARAIALTLPTGVPKRILEGMWYSDFGKVIGRKILETIEDGTYERAVREIADYDLVSVDKEGGKVMMHRLFKDAIRKDSEQESGEWIARIGKALASNPCMAPADWVELLSADGTWLPFCPWGDLNGQEYAEILSANPDAASYIPDWSRISPDGWAMMLRETTRFDNEIGNDKKCRVALLNPADVLEKRPELESRFDFSKLRGWQWSDLIRKAPKFAEKCPFDRFSEDDWEGFISHGPRLSEIDEIISRNRGVRALESLLQKRPGLVERRSDEQDQIETHSENYEDPIAIQCGVPDSQVLSLRYLKRCEHLSAFVLREWPQLRPFVDMTELRDPGNGIYCLWLLCERPCFVNDVIWHEAFDFVDYPNLPDLPWSLSFRHVSRDVDEKMIDLYCLDRWVMANMLDRYPEYAEARGLKKRLPGQWIGVLMDQMRYEEFRMQFNWKGFLENDWYEMFMCSPRSFVSAEWKAVLADHGVSARVKRIGEELMTLNDGLPRVEYLLRELGTADAKIVLRLPCNQDEVFLILTVYLDSYPEQCPKLILSRKPARGDAFLPLSLSAVLPNPDSHTLSLRYEDNWWSPDVTILQIYQDVRDWLSANPSCIGNGESVEIRHAGNAVAK